MSQESKELAQLAKEKASKIHTDLTYQELDELFMLVINDWPELADKYRMAQLLSQIDICWDYAPIRIKNLPERLPFPPPFNTRNNANFLVSKLRRAKRDIEKTRQLKEYLGASVNGWTQEEEVLVEMLKRSPEGVLYTNLPELVTHALITRKLQSRLYRIIEGRDEMIRIAQLEERES